SSAKSASGITALFAQLPHRAREALERQREHPPGHELMDHRDRLAVLPQAFRLGIDPDELRKMRGETLQPHRARPGLLLAPAAPGWGLLCSTLPPGGRIWYGLIVAPPTNTSR